MPSLVKKCHSTSYNCTSLRSYFLVATFLCPLSHLLLSELLWDFSVYVPFVLLSSMPRSYIHIYLFNLSPLTTDPSLPNSITYLFAKDVTRSFIAPIILRRRCDASWQADSSCPRGSFSHHLLLFRLGHTFMLSTHVKAFPLDSESPALISTIIWTCVLRVNVCTFNCETLVTLLYPWQWDWDNNQ